MDLNMTINNINSTNPYIIGETAYNHEGDMKYLHNMIDDIADLNLNAIKFHLLLDPASYMQKSHPLISDVKKWIFTEKKWGDIFDYSKNRNLDIIALCDDVESIEYINKNRSDVSAIELHASGLNDWFLLNEASKFNGIIILGIGGSTIDEIEYAINILKNTGKNEIILMYGFQSYPTNYTDINLSKMLKIKNLFDLPVGYADHTAFNDTNNEFVSIMAATMGFNILEKHYTPDFGKERIDFHAAVGKEQMLKIKELMKIALLTYGNNTLKMSDPELEYGNTGPMKKAIVAKTDIKKGKILTAENLCFKRTVEESPIKQNQFLLLLGLEAAIDVKEDEVIDFSKIVYKFNKVDLEGFTHVNAN